MPMKKIMLSLPEEMVQVLEKERKERYLETIPETVRVILSAYLRNKVNKK
jgi:metal-responsive CopG/Arc/MetJ family transcriptional regulator